jgi:hypothetical protein
VASHLMWITESKDPTITGSASLDYGLLLHVRE